MNEKSLPIRILGIESSCDETAAAIVGSDKTIHANIIRSQLKEHADYGGVVPEIAARAHMEHMETITARALKEAGMTFEQLDAIAVTAGPGLIGGVIVGVMMAKAYASVYQKPLLAINHLEGHALTARLTSDVEFPYMLVLLSGGHCQILQVNRVGDYTKLGATKDDALGEAFDKTAKMMELGYPGGPAIERLATQGDPHRFDFPRPLKGTPGCDFSFSGLKTAIRTVLSELVRQCEVTEQDKADIAASFQKTVSDILRERITNALNDHPANTLVVAGGVAANQAIRQTLNALCKQRNIRLEVPPPALCTDNAAMIAWAGIERYQKGFIGPGLTAAPRARWPLDEE